MVTFRPALWICIRYPSNLTSCSHASPFGGRSRWVGSQGGTMMEGRGTRRNLTLPRPIGNCAAEAVP
jgi:hypothetical protein